MAAQITFNQPTGAGAGVAGKARNDLWISQQVELVSSGTGTTFLWELLDVPPGSTATIIDPTFSTATLTPDVMGSYRISLTVDGGGLGNKVTKVVRARYNAAGVLLNRGWALPAIDEEEGEADYGTNDRDWDEVWQGITSDIRQGLTKTLVFQPGGTSGGNTFDDWGNLMVAFGETLGLIRIVVDESYAALYIPSGVWDLEGRAVLYGSREGARPTLHLDSGCLLLNPAGFNYVTLDNEAGSNGVCILEAGTRYAVDSQFTAQGSTLIWQLIGSTLVLKDSELVPRTKYSNYSLYANYLVDQPAYVSMGNVEDFEKTDAFTLSAWFKAAGPAASLIQKMDGDNQGYRLYLEVSGALSFTLAADLGTSDFTTWTTTTTGYDDGSWHHVLASHDGAGNVAIYVDGSLEASTPAGTLTGTISNTGNFMLNRDAVGYLDDCAVYNSDLGLSDASDIYNGGLPNDLSLLTSAASLVGWWKMGDGDTWPTITDHGGLGFDGTITGSGSFSTETPGTLPVLMALSTNGGLATIKCEGFSQIQAGMLTGTVRIDVYLEGYWSTCSTDQPASNLNIYSPPSVPTDKVALLVKGVETATVAVPVAVGTTYIDPNEIPNSTYTVKFRVIMESTSGSAGYEAYMDLYDINGVLNGGTPAVVSGSQLDTATGSPPVGGPTPNQLVASAYETDVTAAFASLSTGGPGVFEARLWIGVEGGGNSVSCKSAELIFTW